MNDLFAGYCSLRAVAKAQGLNYLAVDDHARSDVGGKRIHSKQQRVAIESESRELAVGGLK